MGMLFRLWWWMRTGRDLVCQLPGTIGKMSTSKQLLIGQGTPHHNHLPRRLVKTMYVATQNGFPIALCCIVAGTDDVPFATVPKYYQKKLTKKWAPFANFRLW
jgi:hypothetical protein